MTGGKHAPLPAVCAFDLCHNTGRAVMKASIAAVAVALVTAVACVAGSSTAISAHGSEPHPTCKKGYTLDDNHRCVKSAG